jgi:hypothetical protein
MYETGKLIALRGEDGLVYMGFVTHTTEHGIYDVDVIADNTYRSTPSPLAQCAEPGPGR